MNYARRLNPQNASTKMSAHRHTTHHNHLRVGRQSQPNTVYAITKCIEQRRRVLHSEPIAVVLFECLDYLRSDDQLKLLAFCIMQDHLHVVLVLLKKKSLSALMKSLCQYTALRINPLIGQTGTLWQEGFYDRCCRDNEEANVMAEYVEHNPVRAGLVAQASDWPFSSASPRNAWLLDRTWYAQQR